MRDAFIGCLSSGINDYMFGVPWLAFTLYNRFPGGQLETSNIGLA